MPSLFSPIENATSFRPKHHSLYLSNYHPLHRKQTPHHLAATWQGKSPAPIPPNALLTMLPPSALPALKTPKPGTTMHPSLRQSIPFIHCSMLTHEEPNQLPQSREPRPSLPATFPEERWLEDLVEGACWVLVLKAFWLSTYLSAYLSSTQHQRNTSSTRYTHPSPHTSPLDPKATSSIYNSSNGIHPPTQT